MCIHEHPCAYMGKHVHTWLYCMYVFMYGIRIRILRIRILRMRILRIRIRNT